MRAATYEQALSFGEWPYAETETYVITSRKPDKPPNGKVAFYSGDLTALVGQLKAASEKDI